MKISNESLKIANGKDKNKTSKDTDNAILAQKSKERNEELIRKLISNGILQLVPALGAAIHYPEAETAWNVNTTQVTVLLEDLVKENFLKVEPLDRVLTCPQCGSPEMYSKYTCPRCKSDNVNFTELLEHIKCGNIGAKDTFKKGNTLICPRCETTITDETNESRIIGHFYQCENCGYRFDRPDIIHVCMNCGTISTYQNAKYGKVYRYTIPEQIVQDLQRELPVLRNLKQSLQEKGYIVQTHVKIKGASGAESIFDLIAEKDNTRLVIDVSTTGDKKDLIALLAKRVDVNPTQAAIIDLTGSGVQDSLAKVYGITVFKTKPDHTTIDQFDEFLKALEKKSNTKN
ncbi:MAG: hypothetical protein GX638_05940 [Crenarchaeota archaeon]|nr:hypothetical protein [Thermoproteota archaeon]